MEFINPRYVETADTACTHVYMYIYICIYIYIYIECKAHYPCGSLSTCLTLSGCAHDSYCPTSGCH